MDNLNQDLNVLIVLLCLIVFILLCYIFYLLLKFLLKKLFYIIFFFHDRNKVLKIYLKFSLKDHATTYEIKYELRIFLEKETN